MNKINYFPIKTRVSNDDSEFGLADYFSGTIVSDPIVMHDDKDSVCYAVRLDKPMLYKDSERKLYISVILVNEAGLRKLP